MHRFFMDGRGATIVVAAGVLAVLGACESPSAAPPLRTRIFEVAQADDQRLPAHHACPAPVEGMLTGTHFVEGELTLYPESAFHWRYTIQQYASRDGIEEMWVEPFSMTGTYVLRGDSLDLLSEGRVVRQGTIDGDVVELNELIPCRYPVVEAIVHQAELYLTEDRS